VCVGRRCLTPFVADAGMDSSFDVEYTHNDPMPEAVADAPATAG
jgi:hypothetical protein